MMLSLEQLLKESERIKPVPQVIHQLMELVDDPDVPLSEITDLILYEPVVTANLLKLANSVAFGFKKKVNSVRDAVVLLGLKRVVEIVLLNSVTESFKSAYDGYGLAEGQLWKQSVACALMASAIADAVDPSIKHLVFTAALIKDIGVLVMDRHMRAVVGRIRQVMQADHVWLVAAERQVLGIDHALLGGQIAANWRFSDELTSTIQNHHLVDDLALIPQETAMVYLADSMCSLSAMNADLFSDNYRHYDRVCRQLGLSELDVNRIMSDFYTRQESIYGLLAIL
jgi:HD-like signal output (HDOD) protein